MKFQIFWISTIVLCSSVFLKGSAGEDDAKASAASPIRKYTFTQEDFGIDVIDEEQLVTILSKQKITEHIDKNSLSMIPTSNTNQIESGSFLQKRENVESKLIKKDTKRPSKLNVSLDFSDVNPIFQTSENANMRKPRKINKSNQTESKPTTNRTNLKFLNELLSSNKAPTVASLGVTESKQSRTTIPSAKGNTTSVPKVPTSTENIPKATSILEKVKDLTLMPPSEILRQRTSEKPSLVDATKDKVSSSTLPTNSGTKSDHLTEDGDSTEENKVVDVSVSSVQPSTELKASTSSQYDDLRSDNFPNITHASSTTNKITAGSEPSVNNSSYHSSSETPQTNSTQLLNTTVQETSQRKTSLLNGISTEETDTKSTTESLIINTVTSTPKTEGEISNTTTSANSEDRDNIVQQHQDNTQQAIKKEHTGGIGSLTKAAIAASCIGIGVFVAGVLLVLAGKFHRRNKERRQDSYTSFDEV